MCKNYRLFGVLFVVVLLASCASMASTGNKQLSAANQYFNEAKGFYSSKNYEKAAEYYSKAMEAGYTFKQADYENYSYACESIGDHETALEMFGLAKQIWPALLLTGETNSVPFWKKMVTGYETQHEQPAPTGNMGILIIARENNIHYSKKNKILAYLINDRGAKVPDAGANNDALWYTTGKHELILTYTNGGTTTGEVTFDFVVQAGHIYKPRAIISGNNLTIRVEDITGEELGRPTEVSALNSVEKTVAIAPKQTKTSSTTAGQTQIEQILQQQEQELQRVQAEVPTMTLIISVDYYQKIDKPNLLAVSKEGDKFYLIATRNKVLADNLTISLNSYNAIKVSDRSKQLVLSDAKGLALSNLKGLDAFELAPVARDKEKNNDIFLVTGKTNASVLIDTIRIISDITFEVGEKKDGTIMKLLIPLMGLNALVFAPNIIQSDAYVSSAIVPVINYLGNRGLDNYQNLMKSVFGN